MITGDPVLGRVTPVEFRGLYVVDLAVLLAVGCGVYRPTLWHVGHRLPASLDELDDARLSTRPTPSAVVAVTPGIKTDAQYIDYTRTDRHQNRLIYHTPLTMWIYYRSMDPHSTARNLRFVSDRSASVVTDDADGGEA